MLARQIAHDTLAAFVDDPDDGLPPDAEKRVRWAMAVVLLDVAGQLDELAELRRDLGPLIDRYRNSAPARFARRRQEGR